MRLTKTLLLASLFVFTLPFLLLNCRKIDRVGLTLTDDVVQKFFTLPAGADPVVAALSQNMLRQEQGKPYVTRFVRWAGYPRWDKAKVLGGIPPSGVKPMAAILGTSSFPLPLKGKARPRPW